MREAKRRADDGLRLYRPRADQMPFHRSRAAERMLTGGVQSGKTVAAVAEFASAARREAITGDDGQPLPLNYPTDRPLMMWAIGYDQRHIARMYRKLFQPGLFKIVRDLETGQYRAWKPWLAEDAAREQETRPAPPLIPARLCGDPNGAPGNDGFAWENKGQRVFSVCRLLNGTEIWAHPSGGRVGKGEAVDVIWIDEDIEYASYVAEWQSRLSYVRGRLIWSAWPHVNNDAIRLMRKRAAMDKGNPKPDVESWEFLFSANPYMPAEERRKRMKGWAAEGEAVLRARDRGDDSGNLSLVFHEFSGEVHGIPRLSGPPDKLDELIINRGMVLPSDWTRYGVLDPGTVHPAVLIAAVPPPEVGDYVIAEREVYVTRISPKDLAQTVADILGNKVVEEWIIDWRAARVMPMGFTETTYDQYVKAWKEAGLTSRLAGMSFLLGSDNIAARNMLVHEWLRLREDGTTKFRVVRENCPHVIEHFHKYRQRVSKEEVSEDTVERGVDFMAIMGYLASRTPRYVSLAAPSLQITPSQRAHDFWESQMAHSPDTRSVHIGWGLPREIHSPN